MSTKDQSGVVAAVQREHREIERLLDEVESSTGPSRRAAFDRLVDKMQAHETAEEQVVHPLAKDEGNSRTVAALLEEEQSASHALERLEGMDPDSDEFVEGFRQLKQDVLSHARQEEREEHPQLIEDTSPDELERRAELFERAERNAAGH